ncbi:MAG: 3'(2'),5'-bisphosphate nucleotidase CysQ [Myxococcales bacterium]|nr:3'(2'),5'-bisphosphate nucleotidase CysQ [Myxococcales bacterium]
MTQAPPLTVDGPLVGLPHLYGALVDLCQRAATDILAVYERAIAVTTKDDNSPLTAADLASHNAIVHGLSQLTPTIPILSEESAHIPWSIRRTWQRFWLVDPLDGTKEFIKRNGEFTVNIALIDAGVPVLGIVQQPVSGQWHLGHVGVGLWRGRGAWQGDPTSPERLRQRRAAPQLRVAVSRSHPSARLETLLKVWSITARVPLGSSLKFCRMVDGDIDAYPRLGPTCGWDTAAAHAVVVAGGGCVVDANGEPLRYNQADSVLNPHFLALADRHRLPELLPDFAA